MSGVGAGPPEDCSKRVDRRRQEHGRQWLIATLAGTRTSAVDAERSHSRRRVSTSDSGWINSDRNSSAASFRQRCTMIVTGNAVYLRCIGNANLFNSPTYLLGGAGVIYALPTARHRSVLSRRNANKQKIKVEFVESVKL